MYGATTRKVLDFVQRAITVVAVALLVAGGTLALVGKHDRGFTLIAVGVMFGLVLLLLRLYRGRYRL